jgi:sugar phosphate isomerase/epimerase
MSLPPVGAQLIVFGSTYNINTDTDLILDCVAHAGYAGVEGAAKDTALYRQKLDARGLRFGATHVGFHGLLDLAPIITMVKTLDAVDVNNSGLAEWGVNTVAAYEEGIRVFNEAGKALRAEGIHLHYHNHAFEFEPLEGTNTTGMQMILDGLDFSVVDLCVDVAWVMIGGQSPAEFLRTHKDKVGFLHFKDHDGTKWTELGRGKVDFASIMDVMPELTGAHWTMIEQDQSEIDPCESCTISRAYLRDTFGY